MRVEPTPQPSEVIAALIGRGCTIATAESLTGGLVCATLTTVPGASAVVRGGIVSYAIDIKASELGVDPGLLERNGAVDPAVAVQMAEGARRRLGADFGVATTGSAGPDPDPGGRLTGPVPPGQGFVAVAWPGGELVSGFTCAGAGREEVRRTAVEAALALLGRALAVTPGDGQASAREGSVEP